MYSDGDANCGQVWTRRVPEPGTYERVVLLGGILDTVDSVPDLPVLPVTQVAGTADPKETRIICHIAEDLLDLPFLLLLSFSSYSTCNTLFFLLFVCEKGNKYHFGGSVFLVPLPLLLLLSVCLHCLP